MTETDPERVPGEVMQPAAWGWRGASLMLAGLLMLMLVLYRDTTLYLGDLWARFEDGAYGHGFPVLAIALYLVYHRRENILALLPCPEAVALPLVAVCTLVWLAGVLADVQLVQVVILLPLLLSVIWAVAGGRVTRQLLFPVMFIIFALPVWSPLLPVLREVTAASAFFLIRLSGITAFLRDYQVQLPSGQLSIEAACSGLNYLLAALTLGVFYAWLNYRDLRARLVVVAVAAGAAILANILRVFAIIYLAYVTDMQHPFVKEHLMLGWYLFGALVLVLLFIDHRLYRRRPVQLKTTLESAVMAGMTDCSQGKVRRAVLLVAVTMLVVSGPAAAWWIKNRTPPASIAILELPPGHAGWSGPVPLHDSWQPVFHGATEILRGYHKGDTRLLLYVGFYPQQSQGSELINELNAISNREDWQPTGAEHPVASSDGQHLIETELASPNGRRRLVWYRYRVAGRYTSSSYAAKLLQVAGLLTGRQGAAVLALAAELEEDQENSAAVRMEMDDFLTAMEPALARIADGKANEQGRDR